MANDIEDEEAPLVSQAHNSASPNPFRELLDVRQFALGDAPAPETRPFQIHIIIVLLFL
jgi:hypothetical protein